MLHYSIYSTSIFCTTIFLLWQILFLFIICFSIFFWEKLVKKCEVLQLRSLIGKKVFGAQIVMGFSAKSLQIWGIISLVFGLASFGAFFYAAVISKLMSPSDNPFISAIQKDRYYCFLVPLSLPILVVAVYFHWLNMKLFKHA